MNEYYDMLAARSDCWKKDSLRTPGQFQNNLPWTSYSPSFDAAQIIVPAFKEVTTLDQSITPVSTLIVVTSNVSWNIGRVIKIQDELLKITSRDVENDTYGVSRGQFGTTPKDYIGGTNVSQCTNSMPIEFMYRIRLNTEPSSYFFTWDVFWTDSFIGSGRFNHKVFQFSDNADRLRWEAQAFYNTPDTPSGGIGMQQYRAYPQTTSPFRFPNSQIQRPIFPGIWSRLATYYVQSSLGDLISAWFSDENHEPLPLYENLPLPPNSINSFWLEFNSSSNDYYRLDMRDLISYVKNFVALKGISFQDAKSLLIKPIKKNFPGRVEGVNWHAV